MTLGKSYAPINVMPDWAVDWKTVL